MRSPLLPVPDGTFQYLDLLLHPPSFCKHCQLLAGQILVPQYLLPGLGISLCGFKLSLLEEPLSMHIMLEPNINQTKAELP